MSMLNAFLKFFILNVLICFAAGANVSFISPTPINSSSQNTNFTNSTLNQTHSLPGKVEVQLPLNDSIKLPVVAASQSSDNNLLLIALCLVVVIAYVIKIKQK